MAVPGRRGASFTTDLCTALQPVRLGGRPPGDSFSPLFRNLRLVDRVGTFISVGTRLGGTRSFTGRSRYSERNPYPDLPFSPRQHLIGCSEWTKIRTQRTVGTILDDGRVLPVQEIEKLEQQLYLDTLANIELL